jgi:hypothetical protein
MGAESIRNSGVIGGHQNKKRQANALISGKSSEIIQMRDIEIPHHNLVSSGSSSIEVSLNRTAVKN